MASTCEAVHAAIELLTRRSVSMSRPSLGEKTGGKTWRSKSVRSLASIARTRLCVLMP